MENIKKKTTELIKQKQMQLKSARFENELIKTFNHFVKEIVLAEIHLMNESSQLHNIVRIGSKFQEICEIIGHDPEYEKFVDFLSKVRRQDRKIKKLIDGYKLKYDYDNPEKFRVKHERSTEDLEFILQALKSQMKSIRQEEEEKELAKKQKIEDREREKKEMLKKQANQNKNIPIIQKKHKNIKKIPIIQKFDHWAQGKLHPEELEENKEKISAYRKNMTKEENENIQKPLTIKHETNVLRQWIKKFYENLLDFESNGYYIHITKFSEVFLKSFETLDENFLKDPKYHKSKFELRSILRENYKNIEDWMISVEIKYKDPQKRNQDEPKIKPTEIKTILNSYNEKRKQFIIFQEDHRIMQIINHEEKETLRLQREKEKAEKKKDKQIRKEETEKERQIKKEETEKERQIKKEKAEKEIELVESKNARSNENSQGE